MATDSGGTTTNGGGRRVSPVRIMAWVSAALLLLLPWVAMQLTDEVRWTLADFAVAGALLVSAGLLAELAVRKTEDPAYRAAVGVALAAAFLLIWVTLAVGIIGDSGDPANLLYAGVLAVGVVGALAARFRPHGMARALGATALAQASVAVVVLIAGWGGRGSGLEATVLNGVFVALFVGSAVLFERAARRGPQQS